MATYSNATCLVYLGRCKVRLVNPLPYLQHLTGPM